MSGTCLCLLRAFHACLRHNFPAARLSRRGCIRTCARNEQTRKQFCVCTRRLHGVYVRLLQYSLYEKACVLESSGRACAMILSEWVICHSLKKSLLDKTSRSRRNPSLQRDVCALRCYKKGGCLSKGRWLLHAAALRK